MEENQVKQFVLDFSKCTSVGEIYSVIKKEMELPEWFGNNLSAFWDGLTGIIEVPAVIIFYKHTKNKALLDYIEKLIAIAHRAEKEDYLGITVLEK